MVFITGDCHSDFSRFTTDNFPEQKSLHRSDTMIITGDFGGIWHDNSSEQHNLDWLSKRRYTTCFVDGNHENFDRLLSDEFETVRFHGGKAKKIRNGVYYLMRGQIYDFDGASFFCMGGASSHDIRDGIVDPDDYPTVGSLLAGIRIKERQGMMFRINHFSWWKEELPSREEMEQAEKTLAERDYTVDYVISHCLPTSIASSVSGGLYKSDSLTDFFDHLVRDCNLQFREWHCGHYHTDLCAPQGYYIHYRNIIRLM